MPPPIELETDPAPHVLIIGQVLSQALATTTGEGLIDGLKGRVALVSRDTKHAVTLDISANRIKVTRGMDRPDVRLSALLSDPGANPTIRSPWRAPRLARRIRQLLMMGDPDWRDAASTFWTHVTQMPVHPAGLRIVCTDTNDILELGDPGNVPMDVLIEGSARSLSNVLSGRSVLIDSVARQKIRAQGSLAHLAVLSDAGIELLLANRPDRPHE